MGAKDAVGRYGEQSSRRACAAGWQVLDRNWRGTRGELDIVALDGGVLVVVEVKTRSGDGFGHPAEAVTAGKLARLRRLAGQWLAEHAVARRRRSGSTWSRCAPPRRRRPRRAPAGRAVRLGRALGGVAGRAERARRRGRGAPGRAGARRSRWSGCPTPRCASRATGSERRSTSSGLGGRSGASRSTSHRRRCPSPGPASTWRSPWRMLAGRARPATPSGRAPCTWVSWAWTGGCVRSAGCCRRWRRPWPPGHARRGPRRRRCRGGARPGAEVVGHLAGRGAARLRRGRRGAGRVARRPGVEPEVAGSAAP